MSGPATRPCRSCEQPIYLLANTSTDRWMPVDVAPSPDGNIAINLHRKKCTVLSGEPLHQAQVEHEDLHLAHHITCPDRNRHRGPTTDKAPALFDAEALE